MKSAKETRDEGRQVTGKGAATDAVPAARLETCHLSVCVGNATPTHCACPTTTDK